MISGFSISLVVYHAGDLRLVNNRNENQCAGRVEMSTRFGWVSVCDDGWDLEDAAVVCRQMGCGTQVAALSNAYYDQGNSTVILDDVACTGSESHLAECKHAGIYSGNCEHHEDAGVICEPPQPKSSSKGALQFC